MKIFSLLLRLLAAAILLQTLYFKFTGASESVAIFSKLGVEPWGRIGTGILELVTAILLFIRPTIVYAALLGAGIMAGAIASHLFVIGIVSANDGGQLFGLAILTFLACIAILFMHRKEFASITSKILK
jgi:hypothetical protein